MKTYHLSKHSKYNTMNPISWLLVEFFISRFTKLFDKIEVKSILDCGCGEGMILKSLDGKLNGITCNAIDIDTREVEDAARNLPFCNVQVGSVYEIPFDTESFDLVICSEVLEHLEYPVKALDEIYRVTKKYALLSTPNEPLWRFMNMCRFKFWNRLGNTPGHINHWSSLAFSKFVLDRFQIIGRSKPIPWTIYLCEKKQ